MVSSTSCHIHEGNRSNCSASPYDLKFSWFAPGTARRYRRLVLQGHDVVKQYIPRVPAVAHRGWTSDTVDVVKSWMQRCTMEHQKCRALNAWKTSNSEFQPKRLVDVGSVSGTTWQLILREDSAIPPTSYATISHRWSRDQQFNLTSGSLEAYTKKQPISQLPGVFQDTIEIAKSLGIRYLWIDCLCIIQDSRSDWETESLEMCKIYANSTCNISLTGFEGSSSNFLNQTSQYACLPYRVQPQWAPDLSEGWYVLDPFFWWAQVTKAPLTKRGWVFQERFLAPCVIHFGPDQVLWECASLVACEAFPQGLPPIVQTPRHTSFKRMDYLFQGGLREDLPPQVKMDEKDLLHQWCLIVESYTQTSLTKPSDKLIALAGVAQLMSLSQGPDPSTSPAKYTAGLFEQHLLLMLEWHVDGGVFSRREPDGVRPPQYRGPSWSWISIDGRAFYDYLPQRINNHQMWSKQASWGLYLKRVSLLETSSPEYEAIREDRCPQWLKAAQANDNDATA
ncbi:hypothetical protein NPX13_g4505 [Xylaria arbuscula]|uniref:Heterokaryon incompatibility domain-containing protein n=1 Tax=Xylaria arbuscula TaxID=114810 RepID=A0A9W8TLV7_9PEZI|nr:hypothetical protein NPX13_g4505 [Xylaria arbuscula]